MSKTAKTINMYSFYLFAMGAVLLLIPNFMLQLFGLEQTSEIWIHLLGLFTVTAGIYYFMSARTNQVGFFRATIIGRLFFFAGVAVTVLGFGQPAVLLAIGGVDLIGAGWTYYHLSRAKN